MTDAAPGHGFIEPPRPTLVRFVRRLGSLCLYPIRRLRYMANPRALWEERGSKPQFEWYPEDLYQEQGNAMAEPIAALFPTSVLELGCGYGRILAFVQERLGDGVRCVGVDFARPQLLRGRSHLGPRPLLAQGSAMALPFKTGSFDLVYTCGVFQHIPPKDIAAARAEAVRVSRRYIVHAEPLNRTWNSFGHDHHAPYVAMGLRAVRVSRDPFRTLRNKPIQFVVMEKSSPGDERRS